MTAMKPLLLCLTLGFVCLPAFRGESERDVKQFLSETGENVSVTTVYGTFIGKRRKGMLKGDVFFEEVDWYLGIPYASPTKRFEKPTPPLISHKTMLATLPGNACVQLNKLRSRLIKENEDCLHLNIYTPFTKNLQLLPVMFYIHGGSYSRGTGSFHYGDKLAQNGVVVVTINYRLTFTGFLSARHPSLNGNYGLHDQIEALKWVQNNIHLFRGDPHRVTIFGNSAGGSSVGLLCLIPQTKGLFSQAIAQSGSPFPFWFVNEIDYENLIRRVAWNVNCTQEAINEMVACLKSVSIEDLHKHVKQLLPISPVNTDFAAVIDGELITDLPENYDHFSFEGPLMTGIVSEEMSVMYIAWIYFYNNLVFYGKDKPDLKNVNLREMIRSVLKNHFVNYTDEDVDKIFKKYLLERSVQDQNNRGFHDIHGVEKPDNNLLQNHKKLLSDIFFNIPVLNFALKHHNLSGHPTYVYEFNYNANFSPSKNYHGIEVCLLFGYLCDKIENDIYLGFLNSDDQKASMFLMKLWTNFAKYGNPNGNGVTRIQNTWQPFTKDMKYYNIKTENQSGMLQSSQAEDLKFWKEMKPLKLKLKSGSNRLCCFQTAMAIFCFLVLKLALL